MSKQTTDNDSRGGARPRSYVVIGVKLRTLFFLSLNILAKGKENDPLTSETDRDEETEEEEEEVAPETPKPAAPGSMFLFKSTNP